jgi:hypothetical protein
VTSRPFGFRLFEARSYLLQMMLVVIRNFIQLVFERSNARLAVHELEMAILVVMQARIMNDDRNKLNHC